MQKTPTEILIITYLVFCKFHHCTVPENIHTPPTEGIGISWWKGVGGFGGSVRPKI